MDGYIKLYKRIESWQWYKESTTLHLFIDLLLDANYEDSKVGFQIIKRGQCLTSLKRIHERTGLTYQQIRTSLDKLQKSQEINKQITNRYSIITINKYNDYQEPNKQVTNKQQTSNNIKEYKEEQELINNMNIIINNWDEKLECEVINKTNNMKCCRRSSYNINGKNYCNQHSRNIIKDILSLEQNFIKPTIEEIQEYCKERNNNVDAERFYNFYESKGWMVGKNKMKDWKSAVRNWEQNNKNNGGELPHWFDNEPKERELSYEEQQQLEELIRGNQR